MGKSFVLVNNSVDFIINLGFSDLNKPAREPTRKEDIIKECLRYLALKDLNLCIQPGEKVAICGRSGRYVHSSLKSQHQLMDCTSGKSSILLLLLRLLDPVSCDCYNITIDNIPLHKLNRQNLRERIIAVPQDAVFLPEGSSVTANLDPLNSSSEAECRAVLEIVGLWKFIEERGGLSESFSAETLSQGQKQLFILARAVLRRKIRARDYDADFGASTDDQGRGGILLLDEVSSNVDQHTDLVMHTVIKEEFKGYTIVMVSHRLEMLIDFDTVVVMEEGSIVESGNPRILLNTNSSRFRELWRAGNNG